MARRWTGGSGVEEFLLPGELFCRWEITAGFRPGEPVDRFSRLIAVRHDEWNGGDAAGRQVRDAREREALAYASRLMSDEAFAWVRVDYVCPDAPWTPTLDA